MRETDESNRSRPETITPLSSFPIANERIDDNKFQRRNQFVVIVLIASLTALIAVGAWFLHYLAQNPPQPPRIAAQQTDSGPPPGNQAAVQTPPPASAFAAK